MEMIMNEFEKTLFNALLPVFEQAWRNAANQPKTEAPPAKVELPKAA
jgi:hypothetical protein